MISCVVCDDGIARRYAGRVTFPRRHIGAFVRIAVATRRSAKIAATIADSTFLMAPAARNMATRATARVVSSQGSDGRNGHLGRKSQEGRSRSPSLHHTERGDRKASRLMAAMARAPKKKMLQPAQSACIAGAGKFVVDEQADDAGRHANDLHLHEEALPNLTSVASSRPAARSRSSRVEKAKARNAAKAKPMKNCHHSGQLLFDDEQVGHQQRERRPGPDQAEIAGSRTGDGARRCPGHPRALTFADRDEGDRDACRGGGGHLQKRLVCCCGQYRGADGGCQRQQPSRQRRHLYGGLRWMRRRR